MSSHSQQELLEQLISELDDLQRVGINERALQFNNWLEHTRPAVAEQVGEESAVGLLKYKVRADNIDRIHVVDETRNTLAIRAIADCQEHLKRLLHPESNLPSTTGSEPPASSTGTTQAEDMPLLPSEFLEKVRPGKLYQFEVDDIQTEDDLHYIIKLMYDYPERDFYYFEEKDGRRNTFIHRAYEMELVLFKEIESNYYPHPNFKHDYVKIKSRGGDYAWDWEKDVVGKGPMFVRYTLRLSERKRREMEIAEKIYLEQIASEAAKVSKPDGTPHHANQLYDKVKGLIEGASSLDEHTARIIVVSSDDAIKEFGNTNQEKKVELSRWKAQAELVLPPATIEELRKRAEGRLLNKSYPKNKALRNIVFAIVALAVIVPVLFPLIQLLPGQRDAIKVEASPTPSPAQSDKPLLEIATPASTPLPRPSSSVASSPPATPAATPPTAQTPLPTPVYPRPPRVVSAEEWQIVEGDWPGGYKKGNVEKKGKLQFYLDGMTPSCRIWTEPDTYEICLSWAADTTGLFNMVLFHAHDEIFAGYINEGFIVGKILKDNKEIGEFSFKKEGH